MTCMYKIKLFPLIANMKQGRVGKAAKNERSRKIECLTDECGSRKVKKETKKKKVKVLEKKGRKKKKTKRKGEED